MASPVSWRNLKRRCLKSQMVRMVRVSSRMKISRSALSCLWLSSAFFSVTMFSMPLLSSGEDDARHTHTHTHRLTSTSSHTVLVALQALVTVTLQAILAGWRSKKHDVSGKHGKLPVKITHRLGNRAQRDETQELIAARKWNGFVSRKCSVFISM